MRTDSPVQIAGNPLPWMRASARFVLSVCLMTALPALSFAGSATITYGFGEVQPGQLPAPSPATVATSPVFMIVQTGTESDTAKAPAPGYPARPKASVGFDLFYNEASRTYNVPLSYTVSSSLYAQLILPVTTADSDDIYGFSTTETGLGDVVFSAKHHFGSERTFELFSLLTLKLATGATGKGLGTGSYDISITEKIIRQLGAYRITLMGGISQPLNEPSIQGSKVKYGSSLVYLAAAERSVFLPALWFSLRVAGMYAVETKVNGAGLNDALSIVNIMPEVRFYTPYAPLRLGLIVPAYTAYDVSGVNKYPVTVNVGASKAF